MKHKDVVLSIAREKYEREMTTWAKRYPVAAGVIAKDYKLSVAEFKELQALQEIADKESNSE